MKIAALLATRKGSKRIRNKSTKKFGKFNLTTLKLNQIAKLKIFSNSYFSSDIKSLNSYAQKKKFNLIERPSNYMGKATISDFAPFLARNIEEEHICYITNTSPLLLNSTLKRAIKIYKKLNFKKYDSLSTFEMCNEFLWDDKGSINYKVTSQPMSQELKGIYKFIPAISIIPKKILIRYKNVIGVKPYKLIIKKPETIDIDTIYDYELAKIFNKKPKI